MAAAPFPPSLLFVLRLSLFDTGEEEEGCKRQRTSSLMVEEDNFSLLYFLVYSQTFKMQNLQTTAVTCMCVNKVS